MALENLVGPDIFIDNLVRTNPAIDDPVSQGDDHLRGIKNSLLNSFPAIAGAVTLTQGQLNEIPTKYAPLESPAFTGIPTAPTAAPGANTTQLATTAFVQAAGIGANQAWQDVTAQRVAGATYTNGTGKPIQICPTFSTGTQVDAYSSCVVTVGGVVVGKQYGTGRGSSTPASMQVIVPPGATYSATSETANTTLTRWTELR